MRSVYCTMYTVQCTVYIVYTMYTVQCTVHTEEQRQAGKWTKTVAAAAAAVAAAARRGGPGQLV